MNARPLGSTADPQRGERFREGSNGEIQVVVQVVIFPNLEVKDRVFHDISGPVWFGFWS